MDPHGAPDLPLRASWGDHSPLGRTPDRAHSSSYRQASPVRPICWGSDICRALQPAHVVNAAAEGTLSFSYLLVIFQMNFRGGRFTLATRSAGHFPGTLWRRRKLQMAISPAVRTDVSVLNA